MTRAISNIPRQRLLELFMSRAVYFNQFILASGQKSTYYINSKKVLFHSEAASLLGEAFYDLTQDLDVQAIGGLEIGAIPLVAVTVAAYELHGKEMEGFFIRKQVKGHGSQERIEGVLPSGARVAIIDDVLTTGSSAQQAVEEVEQTGAIVVAVICIVDRMEGAKELFSPKYEFRSVFTIRDFGIEPPSHLQKSL